jgi:hypothetical protein
MHKKIIPVAATLLMSAVAQAQNNPTPGPSDVDALTWKGITLYGVVDVGLQYQTHGAPVSDYIAYGTETGRPYFGSKPNTTRPRAT